MIIYYKTITTRTSHSVLLDCIKNLFKEHAKTFLLEYPQSSEYRTNARNIDLLRTYMKNQIEASVVLRHRALNLMSPACATSLRHSNGCNQCLLYTVFLTFSYGLKIRNEYILTGIPRIFRSVYDEFTLELGGNQERHHELYKRYWDNRDPSYVRRSSESQRRSMSRQPSSSQLCSRRSISISRQQIPLRREDRYRDDSRSDLYDRSIRYKSVSREPISVTSSSLSLTYCRGSVRRHGIKWEPEYRTSVVADSSYTLETEREEVREDPKSDRTKKLHDTGKRSSSSSPSSSSSSESTDSDSSSDSTPANAKDRKKKKKKRTPKESCEESAHPSEQTPEKTSEKPIAMDEVTSAE